MRSGLTYVEKKSDGTRLWVREDYDRIELIERLDLQRLQRDPAAKRVPTAPGTAVFRFHGGERDLFIKFFLYNRWRHLLKSPFLKAKAKFAWENAEMLLEEGFQTPSVVIVGEKRSFGFVQKSFFVTEGVEAVSLKMFLKGPFDVSLESLGVSRRDFFTRLGHLIGSLHAKGIYHGDLHLGNLLIWGPSSNAKWGFYFLDNEGARRFQSLPNSRRLHDLRDLNDLRLGSISSRDRAYFFKAYLKENPGLFPIRRTLVASLQRASLQRQRKLPGRNVAFLR